MIHPVFGKILYSVLYKYKKICLAVLQKRICWVGILSLKEKFQEEAATNGYLYTRRVQAPQLIRIQNSWEKENPGNFKLFSKLSPVARMFSLAQSWTWVRWLLILYRVYRILAKKWMHISNFVGFVDVRY